MGQVVRPHKTGAGNFACAVCLNIFRFPLSRLRCTASQIRLTASPSSAVTGYGDLLLTARTKSFIGSIPKSLAWSALINMLPVCVSIGMKRGGTYWELREIVQKLGEVMRVPLVYFYAEDDSPAELLVLYFTVSIRK